MSRYIVLHGMQCVEAALLCVLRNGTNAESAAVQECGFYIYLALFQNGRTGVCFCPTSFLLPLIPISPSSKGVRKKKELSHISFLFCGAPSDQIIIMRDNVSINQ